MIAFMQPGKWSLSAIVTAAAELTAREAILLWARTRGLARHGRY